MRILLLIIAELILPVMAIAEPGVQVKKDEVVLSDPVLGCEVRLSNTGILLSARSSYSHPVGFSDRRGINTAYTIAEERAKAQIVRFISQDIASSRMVEQVNQETEKATQSRNAEGSAWAKDNVRLVSEGVKDLTSSSAKGTLRGIRILERTYDENKGEVTVVVGINQQSANAAGQLGEMSDGKYRGASGERKGDFPSVKGESAKSKDFKEF